MYIFTTKSNVFSCSCCMARALDHKSSRWSKWSWRDHILQNYSKYIAMGTLYSAYLIIGRLFGTDNRPIIGIGRLLRRYRPTIVYTLGKYKFLLYFNFVWWMFVRVCTVFVSLTVFVFLFTACDSCTVWTTCQYVTEINIIMYPSMW